MATIDEVIQQLGEPFPGDLIWMFTCSVESRDEASRFASLLPSEFESEFFEHGHSQPVANSSEFTLTDGVPVGYAVVAKHTALTSPVAARDADQRIKTLATQSAVNYLGVDVINAFDLEDLDELMGWIEFDDAPERLSEIAALEFEVGESVPWAFLIGTESLDDLHATASHLAAVGYDDVELFEDVDEDGQVGLCIYVQGTGDAEALKVECQKVERLVAELNAFPVGMQFYDRNDVGDVFGHEPDGTDPA